MQFVQLLLGDEQALKVRLAIDLILQDPERFVMTDEERTEYERLAVFFGTVAGNPSMFAPTGQAAQTVKTLVRRAKGPAQPQSRRNKRKARQERRRAHQKLMRAQRRDYAEQYNKAMEQMRAEMEEAQAAEAELIARFENEPKVMIVRADGVPVMTDIPASMIVPMPTTDEADAALTEYHDAEDARTLDAIGAEQAAQLGIKPKIILPGTAEALGVELPEHPA